MVYSFLTSVFVGLLAISHSEEIPNGVRMAIVSLSGKDIAVRVSKVDASGLMTASWIEKTGNCSFGIFCNNVSRVQRIDPSKAVLSVAEKTVTIGRTRATLTPGMLITTRQGAIVKIDAVFNDGRVMATQMDANNRGFRPGHLVESGLSGIISANDIIGVPSDCARDTMCVGTSVDYKMFSSSPRCQSKGVRVFNNNESEMGSCAAPKEILLAFSDGTIVTDIGGPFGTRLPYIFSSHQSSLFSSYYGPALEAGPSVSH